MDPNASGSEKALEVRLGALLTRLGWTLAVVETTTGGLIASRVVDVPGCSAYFDRGLVAYSRLSKLDVPGVTDVLIDTHGSVSPGVAVALAEGVRKMSGADLGLAETGLAGPIQGRSPKPIGSAVVALSASGETLYRTFIVEGDRRQIRHGIAHRALAFAVSFLEGGGRESTSGP